MLTRSTNAVCISEEARPQNTKCHCKKQTADTLSLLLQGTVIAAAKEMNLLMEPLLQHE